MCAAIDMLSSEQFYGRSPPAGFLTDYTSPIKRLTNRGYSLPSLPVVKPVQLNLKCAQRSCLKSSGKTNKKVVFADDRGFALEQVRFMTEPSHIPPYWALRITASPPLERKRQENHPTDEWQIRFQQPASDYLEFRRKITEDCVALENVIIKQKEGAVDGTVKVKNLDFNKEVLIRATTDGWRSHEDHYCAFLESGPTGLDGNSLYDTFAFRLQLPVHSRRLEFCVSFKCKGNEYWDSNGGANYILERSSVNSVPASSCARVNSGNSWCSKTDSNDNTPYW